MLWWVFLLVEYHSKSRLSKTHNSGFIQMMDAEKDKMRSELEHHRKSLIFQELESKAHRMERSLKMSISTAKPYYELKSQLELQLQVGLIERISWSVCCLLSVGSRWPLEQLCARHRLSFDEFVNGNSLATVPQSQLGTVSGRPTLCGFHANFPILSVFLSFSNFWFWLFSLPINICRFVQ